jgi:diguanylate cyclase (GGDEF)-like protein
MAAIYPHSRADSVQDDGQPYLEASELGMRLHEEIHRAERHGTALSCLLLVIDNLYEVEREHDSELSEQTLTYIGGALARELRDFDRIGRPSGHELLIVLPGAGGPQAEIVARRVLERLRTIKVEAHGQRRPLRVSLGLESWQANRSGEDLLERARVASRGRNGDEVAVAGAQTGPFAHWQATRSQAQATELERNQAERRARR